MSASPVPPCLTDEFWSACNGLEIALWAARLSPCIDIDASTTALAVTIRIDPPRPDGTTPQQLLAQTRRLLRRHRLPVRAEFCPRTYPRWLLRLDTADAARRLTAVVAGHLTGLDAARYHLRLAARTVGVAWYSTLWPHAIRPGTLTADDTHALYTVLFLPPGDTDEFEPEDDDAVEDMLNAFMLALSSIGVDLTMNRAASCPHDIEFSSLSAPTADRLADALIHTRRATTSSEAADRIAAALDRRGHASSPPTAPTGDRS